MEEHAERTISVGRWWRRKQSISELVDVSDEATVRRWVREIEPGRDVTIVVRRAWGGVAVVATGKHPASVFLADDRETPRYAVAPGAPDDQHLTPDEVEDIIVDALTSAGPPEWPDWREL
jgi:hypothetical protein